MSDLHPNWEYLIDMVTEMRYGRIEELSFENGIPVNCKVAVRNINLGAEVKRAEEVVSDKAGSKIKEGFGAIDRLMRQKPKPPRPGEGSL